MAVDTPTYYNLSADLKGSGMSMNDVHKAIFNLERAVVAICYKLDIDNGTVGNDYRADVSTDLRTAMAKLKTPVSSDVT